MKTLTLLPKYTGVPIIIDDFEFSKEISYQCDYPDGSFTFNFLLELIEEFKFPYQSGNEQFKVVDQICQDENLYAMVDFYLYEPN